MSTTAELIADRLFEAGCRYAFGMPGGEVLTVVDALIRKGIRFVLVKNENAGGYMAQAVYRVTGKPAALVMTIGPGASNAVNSITTAMQDRVPMFVITGCVDAAEAETYTHQVIDHGALYSAAAKKSLTLVDGAVDVIVDKAVSIAFDGQPGPVHLDVPVQLAPKEQPERKFTPRGRVAPSGPAQGPDLDEAIRLLSNAQRPIMIAGTDVLNHGSAEAVRGFVRRFNMPLITTYNAKGVLPENDPLSIGCAALSPKADRFLLPLVRESDCVILVGYDPIEMRTGWRDPWEEGAPVIELSAVPNTHYMHRAGLQFVSDTGAGLAALESAAPHPVWTDGKPAAVKQALRDAFTSDADWGPDVVVQTLRSVLPNDCIMSMDTGAHRILAAHLWDCYAPNTILHSVGFGTMGVGVPMAIGAKLTAPDKPVAAITGDGGLEMFLGELATVRDLKLPLIIVVFADQALSLIELKQRNMQLARNAVDFGGTDFAAVARAYGGNGVVANSVEALTEAVKVGLEETERFTMIVCPIAGRAYDGKI